MVDGSPLREHLKAAWERSGVQPKQLAEAPPLPPGCEGLWIDFVDLHSTRQIGMGASRISFTEIDAFERLTDAKFTWWQLEAVRAADCAFMAIQAEKHRAEQARNGR